MGVLKNHALSLWPEKPPCLRRATAGRPVAFSGTSDTEEGNSQAVAEGHSERFDSCHFTSHSSRFRAALPWKTACLAPGQGGLPIRAFPRRTSGHALNTPVFFSYGSRLLTCGSTDKILQLFNNLHVVPSHSMTSDSAESFPLFRWSEGLVLPGEC